MIRVVSLQLLTSIWTGTPFEEADTIGMTELLAPPFHDVCHVLYTADKSTMSSGSVDPSCSCSVDPGDEATSADVNVATFTMSYGVAPG